MAGFIDFDTHVYDPIEVYHDFLDPALRDRAPRMFTDDRGRILMQLDGQIFPSVGKHPGFGTVYGPNAKVDRSGNDPASRLRYMDKEGSEIHVVFPTLGLAGFPSAVRDPVLAAGFSRAYNRYIGGFADADRHRLRPTMMIPGNHPEQAAAEMRWAHAEMGLRLAALPPTPPGDMPWSDPSRDPIWRTAEELGITVLFHETTTGALPNAVGIHRYQTHWPMLYLCTHVLEVQLALADLILGGTLHRFPKLRVGAAEAHVHWLPGWLALMDQNFGTGTKIWSDQSGEARLDHLPSHYFRRQVLLAAFPEDTMIAEAFAVAPDSVVVCSDWPHPIAAEHSAQGLAAVAANPQLSPAIAHKLLVENPNRFL